MVCDAPGTHGGGVDRHLPPPATASVVLTADGDSTCSMAMAAAPVIPARAGSAVAAAALASLVYSFAVDVLALRRALPSTE